MQQDVFQFTRVLVVANGPNVFSDQLAERSIPFELTRETKPRAIGMDPDLILVVNHGTDSVAVPYKEWFPNAQVVVCRGSHKNFSPSLFVVHHARHIDVHWFGDWDEYIVLIGQTQEPQPVLIAPESPNRSNQRYTLMGDVPVDGYNGDIRSVFHRMVQASLTYLNWYLEWLEEVSELSFDCSLKFQKKQKWVRRVVLPIQDSFSHQGMPIFSEESPVLFYTQTQDTTALPFPATVQRITDSEMTCVFPKPISREEAETLIAFGPLVRNLITTEQREFCRQLIRDQLQDLSPALAAMSGLWGNEGAQLLRSLSLTPEQYRKLLQDRSQVEALTDIFSSRMLSQLQGPAGTGKTFVTALAIRQCLERKKVVLVISHSNQGLDNLVKEIAASTGRRDNIFRLGNNPDNVTPEGLPYHRSVRFEKPGPLEIMEKTPVQREVEGVFEALRQNNGIVLACTMSSFLVDETLWILRCKRNCDINVTFVDEASRGFLFELLPIIQATKGKVVFVGDPDQLGNIELSPDARTALEMDGFDHDEIKCFSDGWFNTSIGMSLFPVTLLRINRRSLPDISRLVSQLFYAGRLIPGRFDPADPGQVIFQDTSRAQQATEERKKTSWRNSREANLVVRYVVNRLAAGEATLEDIGIITPYRAQIELIRGKLRQALACHGRLTEWRKHTTFETEQLEDILYAMVNTVDAFQGSQRKIIILSMVRSNDRGEIGFNENVNRLRVAFSRAQDRLVVFANVNTFMACSHETVQTIFASLVAQAKQRMAYQLVH